MILKYLSLYVGIPHMRWSLLLLRNDDHIYILCDDSFYRQAIKFKNKCNITNGLRVQDKVNVCVCVERFRDVSV